MEPASYQERVAGEIGAYEDCLEVHELPPIFHYWSNRYVRPKLEAFGFAHPHEMFGRYLGQQCRRRGEGARFLSLGAGNCDLEIQAAAQLRAEGHTGFVIDCVDLNAAMLERGMLAAGDAGLGSHIHAIHADLNRWTAERQYDAVMANQALHHVLKLEDLFAQVRGSLTPGGCFLISDIIGRNGHDRWPEALEIVQQFWRRLPPAYRFNRQLQRYEELYRNQACPGATFEAIRSEEILPLLLDTFHFQLFIGFANIIDPFVDRSFGYNFDATAEWDRAFIDEVQERDEREILSGRIKPTHMLAVVGTEGQIPPLFPAPLSPQFCLRPPGLARAAEPQAVAQSYQWEGWPQQPSREAEIGARLAEAERQIAGLKHDLEERTAWARKLEAQLAERTAWALTLERGVQEANAVAGRLEEQFQERTAWALRLEQQLQERTAWALQLQKSLRRLAWAARLDGLVGGLLHRVRLGLRRARAV